MTTQPDSSSSAPPGHGDDAAPGTLATIEIAKEYLGFSAGHFTLFNERERENLHGHNFAVACEVTAPVGPAGMCFDYGALKTTLKALCDELDERVLLPGASPWLRVEEADDMVVAHYASERIPFLRRDVLVLDIRNVTVEELAGWFVSRLLATPVIRDNDIRALSVRVSSGTKQWASRAWQAGPSGQEPHV